MNAQRNIRALAFVLIAAIVELSIVCGTLIGVDLFQSPWRFLAAHFFASMLGASGIAVMASSLSGARSGSFFVLSLIHI